MAKQIVIIHGGDAFDSYDAYIDHLKKQEVRLEDFIRKGWKSTLSPELGENYQLLPLRMPNANFAKYLEWKIWFEKYLPFLSDGVILIGHSLGGIFLAKYLAENSFPVTIAATLLIAPPFDIDLEAESLGDFTLPESLSRLIEQGGALHLFHSSDDSIVPFGEMQKYAEHIPNATTHTFMDRGHFIGETFPELIETIQNLG